MRLEANLSIKDIKPNLTSPNDGFNYLNLQTCKTQKLCKTQRRRFFTSIFCKVVVLLQSSRSILAEAWVSHGDFHVWFNFGAGEGGSWLITYYVITYLVSF